MAKGAEIVLEVESRAETGKNSCRRLRAAGRIPGNVYGLDRPPFMVAVDPKRIDKLLRLETGANTIFTLTMAGEEGKREAMIKELQRDPVTERPIHIDFVRVDPNRALHVQVPIRLVGTAVGVRLEGGIMDFVHREVSIECLPGDIPEHVDVSVEDLHVTQHVSLKDLDLGDRIKLLEDPEQIIAVVVAPKAEEAAEGAEEEDAAADGAGAPKEESAEGEGDK